MDIQSHPLQHCMQLKSLKYVKLPSVQTRLNKPWYILYWVAKEQVMKQHYMY